MQLPILVGASPTSANVSMWVVPQLNLVAPATLAGTDGTAWSSSGPITGGTTFTAVPSFMLPAALTIDTTGTIAGTPTSDGYFVVTANGVDASTPPISGKLSFTLYVAAASTPSPVVMAASAIIPTTYPDANPAVTTIAATVGVSPYSYALTSPTITGLTVDSALGVVSAPASLPAGTYEVTVTATDSTPTTPLTNTIQFPLTVALALTSSNGDAVKGTAGQANTLTTINSTGQSGAVTYTLLNPPAGWFTITNGVLATTSSAVAGTYYVAIAASDAGTAANAAASAAGTIYVAVTIQ
jgi:hypothetical protein